MPCAAPPAGTPFTSLPAQLPFNPLGLIWGFCISGKSPDGLSSPKLAGLGSAPQPRSIAMQTALYPAGLFTPHPCWAVGTWRAEAMPGSPHQLQRRAWIQRCSGSAQEERILFPTSQVYRQCDSTRNTLNQLNFKKQNRSHKRRAGLEMKTQSSKLVV